MIAHKNRTGFRFFTPERSFPPGLQEAFRDLTAALQESTEPHSTKVDAQPGMNLCLIVVAYREDEYATRGFYM